MLRTFLSREELAHLKTAVALAEAKTSGEIVPVIAGRSLHSHGFASFLGFMGLLSGTATALWMAHFHPFVFEVRYLLAFQALGLIAGFSLGRSGFVLRALAGQWLEQAVQDAAKLAFLRYGLFNTKDRTGVLIFISVFERKVVILADKGINEKVSKDYWHIEVQKIIAGIREGRRGDAIASVIQEIGAKLAANFPRSGDDKNELSDRVRLQ